MISVRGGCGGLAEVADCIVLRCVDVSVRSTFVCCWRGDKWRAFWGEGSGEDKIGVFE